MLQSYTRSRLFVFLAFTFCLSFLPVEEAVSQFGDMVVIDDFADDTGAVPGTTSDDTITLIGSTIPPAVGVSIDIYDDFNGPGTYLDTVVTDGGGLWSFTTLTLIGEEGLHTFSAEIQGDPSSLSFPVGIMLDFTAPGAPVITGFTADTGVAADNITSDTDLLLTGTVDPFSFVEVFNGVTSLGTTADDGFGNWGFATGALTEATHSLTAVATDGAGHNHT